MLMADREKVISGLQRCRLMNKVNCDKCPYDYNGRGDGKSECTAELATDVLALLDEQDAEIKRLKGALHGFGDLFHTLSEKTKIAIAEQQNVVRCKDCEWWGAERMCENSDSPCFQNGCTHGNWYCADGERRKDE